MNDKKIPVFRESQHEKVCQILADELNGVKIGKFLGDNGIPDPDSTMTKWRRLFAALTKVQNKFGEGRYTAILIEKVFDPVNWVGRKNQFESLKSELNTVLAFTGIALGDDGRLRLTQSVNTLSEAEKRANRLQSILKERNVHPDVLRFCRAELLNDNYFHAVLEASKSISEKLRAKSGLKGDGANLAKDALSLGPKKIPRVAINFLRSESEKSEQTGFMNLIIGLFGTFRNPTAHEPKIYWEMTEEDALDILGIISLIHRKLDSSTPVPEYLFQ